VWLFLKRLFKPRLLQEGVGGEAYSLYLWGRKKKRPAHFLGISKEVGKKRHKRKGISHELQGRPDGRGNGDIILETNEPCALKRRSERDKR